VAELKINLLREGHARVQSEQSRVTARTSANQMARV
jgi:hypothetical protein